MTHHSTIQYPLRPCPYCDDLIDNHSKSGKRLHRYKYDQRKACLKTECQGKAIMSGRFDIRPVLDQPIDLFIYGKAA